MTAATWMLLALTASATPNALAFSALYPTGCRLMPVQLRSHPRALVPAAGSIAPGLSPKPAEAACRGSRERVARSGGIAPRMAVVGTGLYVGSSLYAQQWTTGVVVNSVLALLMFVTGKYKSALTKAGLVHALILGVILWGPLGLAGWSTCVFYLVCGSVVTKVKMADKEAMGIAEGRGGQRGPENVWGSAATAAMCALLSQLSPWDSALFKLGFVASLATKLSDTCGSEIGKAYGKTTYLITNFEKVPPGTEGAISLEGTLAGVVGSLVLSLWGLAANLISPVGVLLCAFAAFFGTNCESVIGAKFQNKYAWLTNEVVNFINTAIGAAAAMLGYILLQAL